MEQVGVCWFDDPKVAGAGWASIAGGGAVRVRGAGELQSSALWVTNIDYRTYQRLNLVQSPHIFDGQYFRTSIKMLSQELGIDHDPTLSVQALSEIFTRLVGQGRALFGVGVDRPAYRYMSILADVVTPAFMRQHPRGRFGNDLKHAFEHATQENQAMIGRQAPYGSRHHVFAFPRGAYARWLLSQPYPGAGEWKEIKQRSNQAVFGVNAGQTLRGSAAVVERLKELGERDALLLRIEIKSIEDFFQPFATFSAGARIPRRWATLPEVLHLSRFCTVAISGGYRTALAPLDLPEAVDLDADEYSLSRSLLLENLWVALSNPVHSSGARTAVGAYMRAYDRVMCAKVAERFARNSFTIGSYGTGRVIVYLREGERDAALRVAEESGVLPPLNLTQGVSDAAA